MPGEVAFDAAPALARRPDLDQRLAFVAPRSPSIPTQIASLRTPFVGQRSLGSVQRAWTQTTRAPGWRAM